MIQRKGCSLYYLQGVALFILVVVLDDTSSRSCVPHFCPLVLRAEGGRSCEVAVPTCWCQSGSKNDLLIVAPAVFSLLGSDGSGPAFPRQTSATDFSPHPTARVMSLDATMVDFVLQ
jgi:hypothetical protein